jgi:hypothetical protein
MDYVHNTGLLYVVTHNPIRHKQGIMELICYFLQS